MAGLLTDYVGVSIKDIADLYVNINQSKLNAGLQKQQNTINQLVAQTELTRQQQKLAESLTVDPQAAQRMQRQQSHRKPICRSDLQVVYIRKCWPWRDWRNEYGCLVG